MSLACTENSIPFPHLQPTWLCRLLDERFERRKDCPLLPVPARAQREIADAEAADCESASGSTDARCSAATNDSSNGDLAASSGARACAALCVATLRCKSWSFRHPTVGLGTAGMPSQHDPRSGVSGEGRRALSTSRSLNRAPVRRSNSRSGSSSSRSRSSGGHRASNCRGYNASSPGKPGSAFTEAVAAQCQLFGFAMRGTAVAGASAAAALGLGQGARWSSGDIDRPAVSRWLAARIIRSYLCAAALFGVYFGQISLQTSRHRWWSQMPPYTVGASAIAGQGFRPESFAATLMAAVRMAPQQRHNK